MTMEIPKPKGKTQKHTAYNTPLVGQWFHSIGKNSGQVEWQGVVIGNPEPGWFLVQLHEWLMGEPNVRHLVRIEDMAGWLFYYSDEQMNFSYDHGTARAGGKYRKHQPEKP
jgi:hypothetical protein